MSTLSLKKKPAAPTEALPVAPVPEPIQMPEPEPVETVQTSTQPKPTGGLTKAEIKKKKEEKLAKLQAAAEPIVAKLRADFLALEVNQPVFVDGIKCRRPLSVSTRVALQAFAVSNYFAGHASIRERKIIAFAVKSVLSKYVKKYSYACGIKHFYDRFALDGSVNGVVKTSDKFFNREWVKEKLRAWEIKPEWLAWFNEPTPDSLPDLVDDEIV